MISDETKAYVADWQKSYWGAETYFKGSGFVSYRINEEYACIENYFIPTANRSQGEGRALIFGWRDYLIEMEPSVKYLLGEVQLNLDGASDKLMMFMHFGAKIFDAAPDKIRVIYFIER